MTVFICCRARQRKNNLNIWFNGDSRRSWPKTMTRDSTMNSLSDCIEFFPNESLEYIKRQISIDFWILTLSSWIHSAKILYKVKVPTNERASLLDLYTKPKAKLSQLLTQIICIGTVTQLLYQARDETSTVGTHYNLSDRL